MKIKARSVNFCASGLNRPADGWEQLGAVIPDAVIHADVNRIIQQVNPAFTRIFGYLPQEILGKSTLEIYAAPQGFYEQGQIRFNAGMAAPSGPYEASYRRKNGERFHATSVGIQVKDETGRVAGFMLMVRDDAQSRETASDCIRLATAVDQATENVVITDPDGIIQYVNPSFEKTTGYSKQEVLGQTPAVVKSGAHDRAFYKQIWDTILDGKPWSGQIKNKRKDGSLYTEDCIITPVVSESGRIINFVGVKHDITRTLALEAKSRQSQRIESLGRLAGGGGPRHQQPVVSHFRLFRYSARRPFPGQSDAGTFGGNSEGRCKNQKSGASAPCLQPSPDP